MSTTNMELTREDLLALLDSTQKRLDDTAEELVAAKSYAEQLACDLETARQELAAADEERAVLLAELQSSDT